VANRRWREKRRAYMARLKDDSGADSELREYLIDYAGTVQLPVMGHHCGLRRVRRTPREVSFSRSLPIPAFLDREVRWAMRLALGGDRPPSTPVPGAEVS
jgi:hypothetical protein